MKTLTSILLIGLLLFPTFVNAASIVKVSYKLDGKEVARATYSAGDRWSDEKVWSLLKSEPMFTYDVLIKPDEPNGLTATLSGKIQVSIELRNSVDLGTLEFKKLVFQRSGPDSQKWFLPKDELKRVLKQLDD